MLLDPTKAMNLDPTIRITLQPESKTVPVLAPPQVRRGIRNWKLPACFGNRAHRMRWIHFITMMKRVQRPWRESWEEA